MAEASPLFLLPGERVGRAPKSGGYPWDTYEMVFGSNDPAQVATLAVNDEMRLSQSVDITGLTFVRFSCRVAPPTTPPAGAAWAFIWGIGAAEHGRRALTRACTFSGAYDVSQLAGAKELRFTLRLEAL